MRAAMARRSGDELYFLQLLLGFFQFLVKKKRFQIFTPRAHSAGRAQSCEKKLINYLCQKATHTIDRPGARALSSLRLCAVCVCV